MRANRIIAIQKVTDYPDSISVYQALLTVWNECQQEADQEIMELIKSRKQHAIDFMKWDDKGDAQCRSMTKEDYECTYNTFVKQALKK